ncbi:MAG TPA: response regulator [Candidatus Saccharimonadia bacterium]|nr:response regulator [Candidatus Saccharimonadia bacterium]
MPTPTILIVEDNADLQKIYQTVLTGDGYNVVVAGDGEAALQQVAEYHPDLILLDMLMVNLGGLEFLRAYRKTADADAKIIIVSNLASPELSQEAIKLGVDRYLAKTQLTPRELAREVKTILAAPETPIASAHQ